MSWQDREDWVLLAFETLMASHYQKCFGDGLTLGQAKDEVSCASIKWHAMQTRLIELSEDTAAIARYSAKVEKAKARGRDIALIKLQEFEALNIINRREVKFQA